LVSNSDQLPAKALEIIERLIQGAGVKNATALAGKLGVTPQAISSAKKKGKIPRTWLKFVANEYDISMDWLLYGYRYSRPRLRNLETDFIMETPDGEQIHCEVKRCWGSCSNGDQEVRPNVLNRRFPCNVNEDLFFLSKRLVEAQDEIRNLTEIKHELEMSVQELRHENEDLDKKNEQLRERIKSLIAGGNSDDFRNTAQGEN
jgi:hypothetical protein